MGGCVGKEHSDMDMDMDTDDDTLNYEGGNVHVITTKEDWDQKIADSNKDGKIVVANFSANWCGPCRVIAPAYAQMSNTYPNLIFLTLDVDDLSDISLTWDIKATPTFFFLKNGKQIGTHVGANKLELEKKLQALAEEKPSSGKKPTALEKPVVREKTTAREKTTTREKPTAREKPAAREKLTAREKPTARDKPTAREKPTTRDKPTARDKPAAREKSTAREKSQRG